MTRRIKHPSLTQRMRSPGALFALVCTLGVGAVCFQVERANTQPQRKVARVTNGFKHDSNPTPSRVVYPTQTSAITFDHAKHSAQACATCHVTGAPTMRATMERCVSCHGTSSNTKKAASTTLQKTNAQATTPTPLSNCASCHQGYKVTSPTPIQTPEQWRAVRPAPMIPRRVNARLKFKHSTHAARAGKLANNDAWCASCHTTGSSAKSPTMPTAAQCTQCHNGTLAQDTCQTCHIDGGNGQLKTNFSAINTPNTTRVTLKPTNHTVNWLERHGPVAQTMSDTCASCHGQDTCTSCHQQKAAVPRSVHPPNFLIVHRTAARASNPNCTTCHQQQTFCVSCHVRTRVATSPGAARPPSSRKFHPPGWLISTQPNNHGVMAKRNINECASCHQERDCLSCHTGISPHPATFSSTCKTMLAANPLPCLKCHTNAQTLRAVCR